ncbi:hypothetical protein JOF41_003181 [Saccharothrix coeruleofusca]|uniref:GNAT family N-acetyltransferase n=1 Tax=Saccharothrix coeruleofusca TaxID=33919 RepID=UPI001AE71CCF|nr:GNAT family N-acetyltransferase [Saccharothrix coeruleofusca]MBP2337003.1 hypothetical protein [Saccharothrix coeruleofusca]
MSWLPHDFAHPTRVDIGTGHHLRPIRESDAARDYPAVMGSRERLWALYGQVWGWPPATMTPEQNRADLARHEREIEAHESFNYVLFDAEESAVLGCVYIDPEGEDALISWWVVDEHAGTDLERALDAFIPRWIARDWPFANPRYGI